MATFTQAYALVKRAVERQGSSRCCQFGSDTPEKGLYTSYLFFAIIAGGIS